MHSIKTILSFGSLVSFASVAPIRAADEKTMPPPSYPLKTCVVSDEKLGEHGMPVMVSDYGTDVWLCYKMCKKDFAKDPGRYTKMVKDAEAAKAPNH